MASTGLTLIGDGVAAEVPATFTADGVRVPADALQAALGWELKPQGLCKAERCVPVAPGSDLVNAAGIDLRAFAHLLGRPLAFDPDERAACLGTAAGERAAHLASLEAPDFTLPDLAGTLHTLSDHRGKKVFLVAYASW